MLDTQIDVDITIPPDDRKEISGTVSTIDFKTLKPRYCCPNCNADIQTNEDGLFICCDTVLEENEVKKNEFITFTIRPSDSEKMSFNCQPSLLEDFLGESISRSIYSSSYFF